MKTCIQDSQIIVIYFKRIFQYNPNTHMPTKLSVAVGYEPQKMIPKKKKDYTPKDI